MKEALRSNKIRCIRDEARRGVSDNVEDDALMFSADVCFL